MDAVYLVIPGPPKGKERPRGVRGSNIHYTPKPTKDYENMVRLIYKGKFGSFQYPKGVPLDFRVIAFYPVPKSDSKKLREQKLSGAVRPTIKPDYDNVGKIICDALNKVAYYDDAQIVETQIRKFYSTNPRVEIKIQIAGGTHEQSILSDP